MTNKEFFISEQQKVQNKWLSADAWLNAEIRRKVKPIVLRIVNSGGAKSNVDIGNAYNNWDAVTNYGENGGGSITRSSPIPGVTYKEFLLETEKTPFKVSQVLAQSNSSGQFNNPITIIYKDANGRRYDEILHGEIDPYQNLTDRILIEKEFLWDGYTTIRFSRINANATINIFIWKKEQFSALNILSGGPGRVEYEEKKIIRAIPIVSKY